MLQEEKADDYVLATRVTTPVRDFANYAAEALDMGLEWLGSGITEHAIDRETGKVAVKVISNLFRPAEVDLLLGDATKASSRLGCKAKVGIRELAAMMAQPDYEDWRS